MVHHLNRWIQASFVVAACLAADAASAKTIHGTLTVIVPGVDAMGNLATDGMHNGPVTIKYSVNTKTGHFTATGKGQVKNDLAMPRTFINQLEGGFMGIPINPMSLQSIYTVKANGHCTVKFTAMLVPPCMEPADADEECTDESAGSSGKRSRPGIDAGRRAIPSVKACLAQQQRSLD